MISTDIDLANNDEQVHAIERRSATRPPTPKEMAFVLQRHDLCRSSHQPSPRALACADRK